MTIETNLHTIADQLTRIADALEGGTAPEKPAKAPAKTTKPGTAGKSSKAAKASKEEPPEATLQDVRKALTALQKATNSDTARALLKDVGGEATLTRLDPGKYQTVIDAAGEAAES